MLLTYHHCNRNEFSIFRLSTHLTVMTSLSFQRQNFSTYYLPSLILDSKFGLIFLFSEICCHGGDTECSDVWSMGYVTNEQECLDYHGGDMCYWRCPQDLGKIILVFSPARNRRDPIFFCFWRQWGHRCELILSKICSTQDVLLNFFGEGGNSPRQTHEFYLKNKELQQLA